MAAADISALSKNRADPAGTPRIEWIPIGTLRAMDRFGSWQVRGLVHPFRNAGRQNCHRAEAAAIAGLDRGRLDFGLGSMAPRPDGRRHFRPGRHDPCRRSGTSRKFQDYSGEQGLCKGGRMKSGSNKYVCQLGSDVDIAIATCRSAGGEVCQTQIKKELEILRKLKEAELSVVPHPDEISPSSVRRTAAQHAQRTQ